MKRIAQQLGGCERFVYERSETQAIPESEHFKPPDSDMWWDNYIGSWTLQIVNQMFSDRDKPSLITEYTAGKTVAPNNS